MHETECGDPDRAREGRDVGVVPWVGVGEAQGLSKGSLERDGGLEGEAGLAVCEIGGAGLPCSSSASWVVESCVGAREGCIGTELGKRSGRRSVLDAHNLMVRGLGIA